MNCVAGFMFSHDRSRVALIRKSKPAWQAGKLNGIGGKMEDADKDIWRAMVREFNEETGYLTTIADWEYFCTMSGKNNGGEGEFCVDFFVTVGDLSLLTSVGCEVIERIFVLQINPTRTDMVENTPWLIWLALDYLEDGRPSFVTVKY